MTSTMSRWVLTGALALGALGVAAVLDVGSSTAEAAKIVSPFAGTYVSSSWPVPITISDGGRITSSYSGAHRNKGSIKGRVSTDGSYAFKLKKTHSLDPDGRGGPGPWHTSRSKYAGDMASDRDGNVFLTDDTHGSFSWLRQ